MSLLPERLKKTVMVRLFGFLKIPMMAYVRPSIIELNEKRCDIKIPLSRRTKNHFNSLYFGSLAVGADCAGGMIAMEVIREFGGSINQFGLVFKDFQAEFHKRPDGDTHFICEQGPEIRKVVEETHASGERVNFPMKIIATVPTKYGSEPVASFVLTLSLKYRKK